MEEHAGIHIRYQLSREEIKTALRASGVFRDSRWKKIVQTVLLGLVGLLFLLNSLTAEQPRTENFIVAAVCTLLITAVWLSPIYRFAARVKQLDTGKWVEAEVFPDVIKMGRGDGAWEIPLDGTSRYKETGGLLMVITPQNRCAAFPVRAIESERVQQLTALLTAGTDGLIYLT